MKRIIISFSLSIFLHLTVFAAIATVQLLAPPKKRIVNVMMIKPVKMPELTPPSKAEPPKKIENKQPEKKIDKGQIAKKQPVKKPVPVPSPSVTPTPRPTPPPIPDFVPTSAKPIATPKPKKTTVVTKPKVKTDQEKEDEIKIATFKKYPSFKNWTDERIKRIPLPPGMKSWKEAEKLTDYLDKEYNWAATPPNLGEENNGTKTDPNINPYATPEPTPTPDPLTPKWKEYKESNNKTYSIRFYKDNIGFIATFNEADKKVLIQYFPFDPVVAMYEQAADDDTLEIKIPENIKPDQIKSFELPLTKEDIAGRKDPKQDKIYKDQLARDILRTYNQENTK